MAARQLQLSRLKLSARTYGRKLKIARIIADLEEREQINMTQLSEAVSYRSLDRGMV